MNLSRSDGLILTLILSIGLLIGLISVHFHLEPTNTHNWAHLVTQPNGLTPIDLNRADYVALTSLPGIGSTLAKRILSKRMIDGPFTAISQLIEIKGIGPVTFERLEGWIQVCGSVQC